MNHYNNHYKDRSPEETISIIKNFFNKKNLRIEISESI